MKSIYRSIFKKYESTNHILTFGLDILWRKRLVKAASRCPGNRCLDICTGTGETALLISGWGGTTRQVFAADYSIDMLNILKRKLKTSTVHILGAKAMELPFPDQTFHLVTLSFATRNLFTTLTDLKKRFMEIHRVLKHGAFFLNLETSQPDSALIRWFFHRYASWIVYPLGSILSGKKKPYSYLANSMKNFFDAEELSEILRETGYLNVTCKKMNWGSIALHSAQKP
ncbi:ubiquinone/menaquinone biosynthesis methyltransferase [bacterium]|nr:ubiquinone/menaquinone biosynthesis methyltransferase [candidate division CSSED10-310 bacterium]